MNPWAWAATAACSISSSVASGRPKAMLSRIVVENRKPSSKTMPTARAARRA